MKSESVAFHLLHLFPSSFSAFSSDSSLMFPFWVLHPPTHPPTHPQGSGWVEGPLTSLTFATPSPLTTPSGGTNEVARCDVIGHVTSLRPAPMKRLRHPLCCPIVSLIQLFRLIDLDWIGLDWIGLKHGMKKNKKR